MTQIGMRRRWSYRVRLLPEAESAAGSRKRLLRFNWLISPGRAIAARAASTGAPIFESDAGNRNHRRVPGIDGGRVPVEQAVRRLRNGEWQMQIDAETWRRLQKVRRHGETISDCIIRVIIVTQHKRGLQ
jgi:hypothetical protein